MANLIVRLFEDCFHFEYMGKAVSPKEICQSGYMLTKHDHAGFMAEMVAASYKFGEAWEAQYFPAVNAMIKRLDEHTKFMEHWTVLKMVDVNQDGETCEPYAHFEAGEDISTIWKWLEDKFTTIKIADYL